MSKAYNSPTARLLQSSRLFSLPRPLPPSALETPSSTGTYRASDTATQSYPTHQAITTPASSHHRGDWGLKRAIPGQSTRSSTPSIRVLGQDTTDHITEFESASDHERSREKWAEMGIPIVVKQRKRGTQDSSFPNTSVYEDFLDNTDPDAGPVTLRHQSKHYAMTREGATRTPPPMVERQRWKHNGPWIAGMQEGEFERYVQRQLLDRREEWNEFLMDELAKKEFETERRAATSAGRWYGPLESAPPHLQAEMIVAEAEGQQQQLLEAAFKKMSPDAEAQAREEGERLIAEARERAQVYEQEYQRQMAPQRAREVLSDAQRRVDALNRRIKDEGGDPYGELTNNIAQIHLNGIQSAYELLGVTEVPAEAEINDAYRASYDAEATFRSAQSEKSTLQAAWEAERLASLRPSLENLASLEKELRDDHLSGSKTAGKNLSSDLTALIVRFLDLPALTSEDESSRSILNSVGKNLYALIADIAINDSDSAPPTTHPAAGLSHLRTNAYMENHPIYGPQAHHSPVLSRVLLSRQRDRGSTLLHAHLGVGGFVALDETRGGVSEKGNNLSTKDPTSLLNPDEFEPPTQNPDESAEAFSARLQTWEKDNKFANKLWVHPRHATIDERGRIRLEVSRADKEAVAVKLGGEEMENLHRSRMAPVLPQSKSVAMPVSMLPGEKEQPRANYGSGLPDQRRMALGAQRDVRGQAQARNRNAGGQQQSSEAFSRIQELSRGLGGRSQR